MSSRARKKLQAVPKLESPSFLERRATLLAFLLVLIASIRIAATYTVFNHTADEPAHIAAGMQWLDRHVYLYEPQHPPLARVAAALGPYLLGIRSQATPGTGLGPESIEGAKILYRDHHYDLTLAMARLGILPFFWIACLTIYIWGRRYYGATMAVAALFFFTLLPPVLAHAALATTDMALTAFVGATFITALRWMEAPSWRNSFWFGGALGLAIVSKFSSLAFLPAVFALALAGHLFFTRTPLRVLYRQAIERLATLSLALAAAAVIIRAIYYSSLSTFFAGIRAVAAHNAEGHPTYLLGRRSTSGFWYFYPVVLAVKTPFALLVLIVLALWWTLRRKDAIRREWPVLAFLAGILAVGLFSRINIGVRHILPVYFAFSLLAAGAATELARRGRAHTWIRAALALLLLWYTGSSLASHPDYLAYTNLLAGSAPEKVLADSDLDWGQDMKRLAARLREVGARQVAFEPIIVGDFEGEMGFPPITPASPILPSPGWNAVSLSLWKVRRMHLLETHPEAVLWPDRVPPGERIGKGIMLWYFPPARR